MSNLPNFKFRFPSITIILLPGSAYVQLIFNSGVSKLLSNIFLVQFISNDNEAVKFALFKLTASVLLLGLKSLLQFRTETLVVYIFETFIYYIGSVSTDNDIFELLKSIICKFAYLSTLLPFELIFKAPV